MNNRFSAPLRIFTPCECRPQEDTASTAHYQDHFVPTKAMKSFNLIADDPEIPRFAALMGTCSKCGGTLPSPRIDCPETDNNSLLARLWEFVENFRPYTEAPGPDARVALYKAWDAESPAQRKRRFLALFTAIEQMTAMEWLSANVPASRNGPGEPLDIDLLFLIMRALRTKYLEASEAFARSMEEVVKDATFHRENHRFPETDPYTEVYRYWETIDTDLLNQVGLRRDEETYRKLLTPEFG